MTPSIKSLLPLLVLAACKGSDGGGPAGDTGVAGDTGTTGSTNPTTTGTGTATSTTSSTPFEAIDIPNVCGRPSASPNGRYLAFVECEATGQAKVLDVTTGEIATHGLPTNSDSELRWASNDVIYSLDGIKGYVRLDGSAGTDEGTTYIPAVVLPDGSGMLVGRDQYDLWKLNFDGTEELLYDGTPPSSGSRLWTLRVSDSGNTVAFVLNGSTGNTLVALDLADPSTPRSRPVGTVNLVALTEGYAVVDSQIYDLQSMGPAGSINGWAIRDQGEQLYWLSPGEFNWQEVGVDGTPFSMAAGVNENTWWYEQPDRDRLIYADGQARRIDFTTNQVDVLSDDFYADASGISDDGRWLTGWIREASGDVKAAICGLDDGMDCPVLLGDLPSPANASSGFAGELAWYWSQFVPNLFVVPIDGSAPVLEIETTPRAIGGFPGRRLLWWVDPESNLHVTEPFPAQ